MTEAHNLDRFTWTDADFVLMGWHDATIHACAFLPETHELALDIDYIIRWVDPAAGNVGYTFWVAPATLVFENASEVQIELEPISDVTILELERLEEQPTRPGFVGPAKDWQWVLDCKEGTVQLRATGFRQFPHIRKTRARMKTDTLPVVLVIDDQPDYLDLLEIGLSGRYSVLVAQNGLDGYALACQKQPDAIVIDLMMPTVDGWTVLRKLRVNPELTATPVIVVTAVDRNTIKRTAAHFQVAGILQKPCTADDVSAAISAALEAAGRGRRSDP